MAFRHGFAGRKNRHPLYARWVNIRQRCNNPNHERYADYGGRGITVCERWDNFEVFAADVGEPPASRMSLDRIDNDGPYSPENVRWSTAAFQRENQYRLPRWMRALIGGEPTEDDGREYHASNVDAFAGAW